MLSKIMFARGKLGATQLPRNTKSLMNTTLSTNKSLLHSTLLQRSYTTTTTTSDNNNTVNSAEQTENVKKPRIGTTPQLNLRPRFLTIPGLTEGVDYHIEDNGKDEIEMTERVFYEMQEEEHAQLPNYVAGAFVGNLLPRRHDGTLLVPYEPEEEYSEEEKMLDAYVEDDAKTQLAELIAEQRTFINVSNVVTDERKILQMDDFDEPVVQLTPEELQDEIANIIYTSTVLLDDKHDTRQEHGPYKMFKNRTEMMRDTLLKFAEDALAGNIPNLDDYTPTALRNRWIGIKPEEIKEFIPELMDPASEVSTAPLEPPPKEVETTPVYDNQPIDIESFLDKDLQAKIEKKKQLQLSRAESESTKKLKEDYVETVGDGFMEEDEDDVVPTEKEITELVLESDPSETDLEALYEIEPISDDLLSGETKTGLDEMIAELEQRKKQRLAESTVVKKLNAQESYLHRLKENLVIPGYVPDNVESIFVDKKGFTRYAVTGKVLDETDEFNKMGIVKEKLSSEARYWFDLYSDESRGQEQQKNFRRFCKWVLYQPRHRRNAFLTWMAVDLNRPEMVERIKTKVIKTKLADSTRQIRVLRKDAEQRNFVMRSSQAEMMEAQEQDGLESVASGMLDSVLSRLKEAYKTEEEEEVEEYEDAEEQHAGPQTATEVEAGTETETETEVNLEAETDTETTAQDEANARYERRKRRRRQEEPDYFNVAKLLKDFSKNVKDEKTADLQFAKMMDKLKVKANKIKQDPDVLAEMIDDLELAPDRDKNHRFVGPDGNYVESKNAKEANQYWKRSREEMHGELLATLMGQEAEKNSMETLLKKNYDYFYDLNQNAAQLGIQTSDKLMDMVQDFSDKARKYSDLDMGIGEVAHEAFDAGFDECTHKFIEMVANDVDFKDALKLGPFEDHAAAKSDATQARRTQTKLYATAERTKSTGGEMMEHSGRSTYRDVVDKIFAPHVSVKDLTSDFHMFMDALDKLPHEVSLHNESAQGEVLGQRSEINPGMHKDFDVQESDNLHSTLAGDQIIHPMTVEEVYSNVSTNVQRQGRVQTWSSMVIITNGHGICSLGFGKGSSPGSASSSAIRDAKNKIFSLDVAASGGRIYSGVVQRFGATIVELYPTSGSHRGHPKYYEILEKLGLRNIGIRIRGRKNPLNVWQCLFKALQKLTTPEMAYRKLGVVPVYDGDNYTKYRQRLRNNKGIWKYD